MKYRGSICEPFNKNIIEIGEIPESKVIETFENFKWTEYLKEMQIKPENEVCFSPSLEIENIENKNGLTISAVGEPGNFEFYIFYKRPKEVKQLFGLIKRSVPNFDSIITGQTKKDVLLCLHALLKSDLAFLEEKIK